MKFIQLVSLLMVLCLTSCSDDNVDVSQELQVNRGVFRAVFDGVPWEGKKINAQYDIDTDGSLDVSAGQESDTIVFLVIDDASLKNQYERDSLNPSQNDPAFILSLSITGYENENLNWTHGTLEILELTRDSLEARFQFTTAFNTVTDGYTKISLGN